MNSLEKRVNIRPIAFTIALVLIILRKYMISFIDPAIDVNIIKSLLFYGPIGILGILFIFDSKKSISEILIVGICSILYVINREGAILLIVLLAVVSKTIDDKYIVKNYLAISVLFLVTVILVFNLLPWLQSNQEVHYRYIKSTDSLIMRMDYGLGNPNAVFYHMVTIYAAYIFLRFEEYNLWDRVILFGSAFFIYETTYSRTGFFTILAGLLFMEFVRIINLKKVKILPTLIKISPIILIVISVAVGTVFHKQSALNRALASRPKYWNVYLSQKGNFLKPFGNVYDATVKGLNPLDSSYVYIISVLGIISCILFMYLLYKGIESFIEKNKKAYLVVVVIFLMYSFAENLLLEAAFSFGMILLIKEFILNDERYIYLYNRKNRRM